jgi:long-chain fatty acid transport protein
MKKLFIMMALGVTPILVSAQAGHIMQGIGAVNMSMGGAATAQPLDINGALHWNPAAISAFSKNTVSANAGFFLSSPELFSSVTMQNGQVYSGTTQDDRGTSVMPALAMVFAKEKSKHHFGISAFGISGFGVTFPENMNNPINMPQSMGGFGHIESDYQLMQVGLTYAYAINEKFSIGIAPTFNYSALELAPNPLSSPSPTKGYPVAEKASALGYGAQFGLFFNSGSGFKFGASYKTEQSFEEFDFTNKYLDGSTAPNVKFTMNYPAIISVGLGYSKTNFDIAVDYRYVDYANTEGFERSGWTETASVAGFGWQSISVVSAGLQYKGVKKLPLRVGYTYSSNPIKPELAFFSVPATAVIANAFQLGFGYEFNANFNLNATYHHGASAGSTAGPLLSPMMASSSNPTGVIPGSKVSYSMSTDLFMIGLNYSF